MVVVQTTEAKFQANKAGNATFEGQGQIFAQFGSKMAKKFIIFKNFTLFR